MQNVQTQQSGDHRLLRWWQAPLAWGRRRVQCWQAAWRSIQRDVDAVLERDPAAKSRLEVWLAYPGFHALLWHRVSHGLYRRRHFLLARLVSHVARFLTGIEIHPGAQIGQGVFIDHGLGVVIGETAEVGDDVTIYQGATLGGTGKEKGKRHPTIGKGVVISAGAKILGSFRVGDYAKIGAGAVVLKEVPPGATVVGVPGRVVRTARPRHEIDLNHDKLPDPEDARYRQLLDEIALLEYRVQQLEERLAEREPLTQIGALAAPGFAGQPARRHGGEEQSPAEGDDGYGRSAGC